jgi:hypothetical protein
MEPKSRKNRCDMLREIAAEHGGCLPFDELIHKTAERFRIASHATLETTAYRMCKDGHATIVRSARLFRLTD